MTQKWMKDSVLGYAIKIIVCFVAVLNIHIQRRDVQRELRLLSHICTAGRSKLNTSVTVSL